MEDKRELKNEEVEQVTGGVTLPLNMASSSEASIAATDAGTPATPFAVPAGIVDGAAIMIGGAWAYIDHQQPGKTIRHGTPIPTPEAGVNPTEETTAGGI